MHMHCALQGPTADAYACCITVHDTGTIQAYDTRSPA